MFIYKRGDRTYSIMDWSCRLQLKVIIYVEWEAPVWWILLKPLQQRICWHSKVTGRWPPDTDFIPNKSFYILKATVTVWSWDISVCFMTLSIIVLISCVFNSLFKESLVFSMLAVTFCSVLCTFSPLCRSCFQLLVSHFLISPAGFTLSLNHASCLENWFFFACFVSQFCILFPVDLLYLPATVKYAGV